MQNKSTEEQLQACNVANILALKDTITVVNGKWKAAIIYSLAFGKKRYNEMLKGIPKMNPRMLSKELKEFEMNGIITRVIHDSFPVIIEYELTGAGLAFKENILDTMLKWGLEHRKAVFGK